MLKNVKNWTLVSVQSWWVSEWGSEWVIELVILSLTETLSPLKFLSNILMFFIHYRSLFAWQMTLAKRKNIGKPFISRYCPSHKSILIKYTIRLKSQQTCLLICFKTHLIDSFRWNSLSCIFLQLNDHVVLLREEHWQIQQTTQFIG